MQGTERTKKPKNTHTHTLRKPTFLKIALDLCSLATDKDGQWWRRPTKTGFGFPKHSEEKRSQPWTPQKLKTKHSMSKNLTTL